MLMCAVCETWSAGTPMVEAGDILSSVRRMSRIHLGGRLIGMFGFVASCARTFLFVLYLFCTLSCLRSVLNDRPFSVRSNVCEHTHKLRHGYTAWISRRYVLPKSVEP